MKQIIALFSLLLLFNCNDKKDNIKYLSASSGNINSISVVADNILWENNVGGTIRETLAAPAKGLPTDEPMFSLKQIPTQVFDGFVTRGRTILKIEKTDASGVEIKEDVYAKPQTVVIVRGKTNQEIINTFKENEAKIIDAFTKREVAEKLRRINKSLLKDEKMEEALGFTIEIPSAYKISKSDDNFFWLQKALKPNKTMDLMFYSYPLDAIRSADSTTFDIIKMRDKMVRNVPTEDDMIMQTEQAFAPSIYKAIVDNKPAFETRGMWRIKDDKIPMGGPFINYAIEDKVNNRYLVAEGYVYAPGLDKRQYVFELESIIKSIKIK